MSNLPFLSKLLERCMLHHFTKHCEEFGLSPDFQSAYHEGYSCETSLLGRCDGILNAMEHQEVTAVTIMDLSAAFDTVDHDILLSILSNSFGIHDSALSWFKSYLRPRSFKVCKDNKFSKPRDLSFSVPRGSSSGAFIYLCYASPITTAVPTSMTINGFTDDHSIRNKFKGCSHSEEQKAILEHESTVRSINLWMNSMRLKMNDDKTEFILFGSRQQLHKCESDKLKVNESEVPLSTSVKYLGAYLDAE